MLTPPPSASPVTPPKSFWRSTPSSGCARRPPPLRGGLRGAGEHPGLSLRLEHRVRHKDGTWRWVEGTFASLFDDPDKGGLLATVRDVTERKRAEEALRSSEEKYHALLRVHRRGVLYHRDDLR